MFSIPFWQKGSTTKLYKIVGTSLSEPHTSQKLGVIDHTQTTMTKIGLFTCTKRIQQRKLATVHAYSLCYHPCYSKWTA